MRVAVFADRERGLPARLVRERDKPRPREGAVPLRVSRKGRDAFERPGDSR